MKHIYLILITLLLFSLTACGMSTKGNAGEQISENSCDMEAQEGQENATIPTGNLSSTTEQFVPVTWEESYYGDGTLKITISSARVVTGIAEIDEKGFFDDASAIIYHEEWYDDYCRDWRAYEEKYMTVYGYGDFCDDNGNFADGIRMILLDVTVENLDASNRYQEADGSWVSRLGNLYVFNVQFIGKLLDLNQKDETSQIYRYYEANYYSGLNTCPEMSGGFEVRPGENISFQLGFLIGNNEDGSAIDLSGLAISRSATLDYMWFELKLQEET